MSENEKSSAASELEAPTERAPNLFIKFHRSVWEEPDPKLLNQLYILSGTNTWLPDEKGGERTGPYVRMRVEAVTDDLRQALSNSLNVWEWDEKPFMQFCDAHKIDACEKVTDKQISEAGNCGLCGDVANWIA